MSDEFYIGWEAKAAPGIGKTARKAVVIVLALALLAPVVFAFSQRLIGASVFEWGNHKSFSGILQAAPYPHLLVPRPGNTGPRSLQTGQSPSREVGLLMIAWKGASSQGRLFCSRPTWRPSCRPGAAAPLTTSTSATSSSHSSGALAHAGRVRSCGLVPHPVPREQLISFVTSAPSLFAMPPWNCRTVSQPTPREDGMLALAGTGYGLIGILVIILLVVLIIYFVRRA